MFHNLVVWSPVSAATLSEISVFLHLSGFLPDQRTHRMMSDVKVEWLKHSLSEFTATESVHLVCRCDCEQSFKNDLMLSQWVREKASGDVRPTLGEQRCTSAVKLRFLMTRSVGQNKSVEVRLADPSEHLFDCLEDIS